MSDEEKSENADKISKTEPKKAASTKAKKTVAKKTDAVMDAPEISADDKTVKKTATKKENKQKISKSKANIEDKSNDYAVLKSGGKQYVARIGEKLNLEKLEGGVGDTIKLDHILTLCEKGKLHIGKPILEGALVEAEITKQFRTRKITVFKKKRRQNYRRTNSHRQHLTEVMVKKLHVKAA